MRMNENVIKEVEAGLMECKQELTRLEKMAPQSSLKQKRMDYLTTKIQQAESSLAKLSLDK